MERRRYSEFSTNDLARAKSVFEHKMESARRVLHEISRPDWVTSQRAQRMHSPRWGKGLDLHGLTEPEQNVILTETIIPIQTRLAQHSIPTYAGEIWKISEAEAQIRETKDPEFALNWDGTVASQMGVHKEEWFDYYGKYILERNSEAVGVFQRVYWRLSNYLEDTMDFGNQRR